MRSKLRLRARVRLEDDDGGEGGMLFDTQTAAICACNASAWSAVRALRKGADADGMTAALLAEFDVDEAQASRDVSALVKELGNLDLLEPN